jgi:hypothetical protein
MVRKNMVGHNQIPSDQAISGISSIGVRRQSLLELDAPARSMKIGNKKLFIMT